MFHRNWTVRDQPGEVVTRTPVSIPPQGVWTDTVVVIVETDYSGPLVNVVEVTADEDVSGRYVHTLAPGLEVFKQARADTVWAGEQLTYTLTVTNTGNFDLHATVTGTLPLSVTLDEASGGTLASPGGTVVLPEGRVAVTWTPVITAPGGPWMGRIVVTVDEGYAGPLTNLVEVATKEGVQGSDSVTVIASRRLYLPLVVREFS
jgi:uncharacterized repeat protein (TIGR01451 family)